MWTRFAYDVGGLLFTLDDIEHGVLRCNRGHPKDGKAMFNDKARKCLALKHLDHRIHFALNCGALSCPPIRIYQTDKLDEQLDKAAKSFNSQEISVVNGKVVLSKLLLWYKKDFGQTDDEVLVTLAKYVTDENLKSEVLKIANDNNIAEKIVYKDYNWTLNSKQ